MCLLGMLWEKAWQPAGPPTDPFSPLFTRRLVQNLTGFLSKQSFLSLCSSARRSSEGSAHLPAHRTATCNHKTTTRSRTHHLFPPFLFLSSLPFVSLREVLLRVVVRQKDKNGTKLLLRSFMRPSLTSPPSSLSCCQFFQPPTLFWPSPLIQKPGRLLTLLLDSFFSSSVERLVAAAAFLPDLEHM